MTENRLAFIPFIVLLTAGCASSSRGVEGVAVGPEGGTVGDPACNAVLEIPAGAVDDTVRITVTPEVNDGSDPSIVSDICTFGPADVVFAEPALVRFGGLGPAGDTLQNVVSGGGIGAWEELRTVAVGGVAIGEAAGTGTFAVRALDGVEQGASSCPDVAEEFAPCGGDPVGTFRVESLCFADVPAGLDPFRGACPAATVDVSIDIPLQTEVEIDDDTFSLAYGDLATRAVLTFPTSCGLGEECEFFGCEVGDADTCTCGLSEEIVDGGLLSSAYALAEDALETADFGAVPFCADGRSFTFGVDDAPGIDGVVGGEPSTIVVSAVRDVPLTCDTAPSGPMCPATGLCAELLTNGDFESADPVAGGQPTTAGVWQGDLADRVTEVDGVAACGDQMMSFIGTTATGGSFFQELATVAQVVDLSGLADDVDRGDLFLEASALVDRVVGDEETDTEFRMQLFFSEAVLPADPSATGFLAARNIVQLVTPEWQRLLASTRVPSGTRSVAVRLQAFENVGADFAMEFDGHFADGATVLVHREGGVLPLLGYAAAGEAVTFDLESDPPPSAGLGTSDAWSGDVASIVEAENGVVPSSGDRMLRFDTASEEDASSFLSRSQVYRFIELGDEVRPRSGGVVARVEARVNRVLGNENTDDQFVITVYAFPTPFPDDPATFAEDLTEDRFIAETESLRGTDDDPATWEPLTADLLLPLETRYLAIEIAAVENVANNVSTPEFDGHYADDVRITLLAPD